MNTHVRGIVELKNYGKVEIKHTRMSDGKIDTKVIAPDGVQIVLV